MGGADGRSRDVVSEIGGGKNLRREETGLELCSVYDAASFHTSPSFMLLSQLLQSTVALLQINSDCSRERVGLSAASSIVPICTPNTVFFWGGRGVFKVGLPVQH